MIASSTRCKTWRKHLKLKRGDMSINQQAHFEEGRFLTPTEVARREARQLAALRVAQESPGTFIKHLRLSIDFHVTIAGTPPDDDGMNVPDPAYHARQARLLAAVKSHPTVLKQWVLDLIVSQMGQKSWSDWYILTGGEVAQQEMLAPALARLSEEDQAYFADVDTEDFFDDLIDLFAASLTIVEEAPVVHEVGEGEIHE